MGITKIEWTSYQLLDGTWAPGYTFNPWLGCQKVSPGCDNCYAEAMMDHRYGRVQWGPHGERVRTSAENWKKPFRWAWEAEAAGNRPRVFCASLADVFDNQVPPDWRMDLFAMIECTPQLDWLLLTKRPENIRKMVPLFWQSPSLTNVWLGTTIESPDFWYRYDELAQVPCPVRFISYEPALAPLELSKHITSARPSPHWIICGGESGAKARMMEVQWARDLRDECGRLGIPYFFKQMTKKAPIPTDLLVRQFPRPQT